MSFFCLTLFQWQFCHELTEASCREPWELWGVNRWSLAPAPCQQEPPVWGAVEKETSFSIDSSTAIQQGCESSQSGREVALGPHPPPAGPLRFPLVCSALLWGVVFGVSAPIQSAHIQKHSLVSLVFGGEGPPGARGELDYLGREKSPPLVTDCSE